MNGVKEAYAKQRNEKEREKGSFARVGISNAGLPRRTVHRSSDLRELLSGISINDCLHCADRSYDDVLNGPCNVYVDVGEVARIKRDLFRRNETYRGSFARYVKQVYFISSLSRDKFMRLEMYNTSAGVHKTF